MSGRFYVKKKKNHARSQADEDSAMVHRSPAHAAEPPRKGRPRSIKSEGQRVWLENKRAEYERASQKGRKAASAFISQTTTAFLNEFGWSEAHFRSGRKDLQDGDCEEKEGDVTDTDSIYKVARQVYQLYHHPGNMGLTAQTDLARSFLQPLLDSVKPVRRPKAVNVFQRSAYYTADMRAQFAQEWKNAMGSEDEGSGALRCDDDNDDDNDDDGSGGGGDDPVSGSDDDDEDGDGRAAGRKDQRLQLVQEEQFLAQQLDAASAEVKAEIEKQASAEYEQKLAEREAWLRQGPKTFEEAAAFQGGASRPADSSADATPLTFDQSDPGAHGEICQRIHEHALHGLGKSSQSMRELRITKCQLRNSGSLALMVPQKAEDDPSDDGSDMYWPGEVLVEEDVLDKGNAPATLKLNAEDGVEIGKDMCACADEDGRTSVCEDGRTRANKNDSKDSRMRAGQGTGVLAYKGYDTCAFEEDDALAHLHEDDGERAVEDYGGFTHEDTGVRTDEKEILGDLMTQEEQEYWDAVMWLDEDEPTPKEIWLGKVSKPWMVRRVGAVKGKKSWIDRHARVVAEVVRSTMDAPPGMEGSVAYPSRLMEAFDAATELEGLQGFEVRRIGLQTAARLTIPVKPAASESSATYLDELPDHLQPNLWKVWKLARFPATLPVAAEGELKADYGLQLMRYWIACQPKARLPQPRRGGLEALAAPEESMDWGLLGARGPGGTFGFVWGLTIWAANITFLCHTRHWNALATDLRQVFVILALKERQKIAARETPQGGPGIHDVRGSASASSGGGQISAVVSISAASASAQVQASARAGKHAEMLGAGTSAEDGGRRVRKESQRLQESKRHAEAIEAAKKKRRKITGEPVAPGMAYGHGQGTEVTGEAASGYGRGRRCRRGGGRGQGQGQGSESRGGPEREVGIGRGRGRS
ncbi:hypothetical protein K488DRAFT_74751 [Vararia minispora EC-137]|uniref:Uncharacterized protein n=1 Tax=Vararia minispora EC-137 TaxID=1314806 RepID=A0ACB8Q5W7_9AGAM|nr:hypothetical protein K488DRAFT_74751 [Vararia minispora EC-137]